MIQYDRFKSKEEAIERLLIDVKRFKVALPDNFNAHMLYDGCGEGVCYIVNDLTNRELIRKNFKFEIHRVLDEAPIDEDIKSETDRDDHIIEGSTVFNNLDFMDREHMAISRMAADRLTKAGKDLTHESIQYKFKKGKYFQELNKEPVDDDLHSHFQNLLANETTIGRSDPLFRGTDANTGSTMASSEHAITSRSFAIPNQPSGVL